MNKFVKIAIAAAVALSAGSVFANPVRVDDESPEMRSHREYGHGFCHYWREYLEHYGETRYFERFIERDYKRYCHRHERGDRDGHDGDESRGDGDGKQS